MSSCVKGAVRKVRPIPERATALEKASRVLQRLAVITAAAWYRQQNPMPGCKHKGSVAKLGHPELFLSRMEVKAGFFLPAENRISCTVWVFDTVRFYYELSRGGITACVGCREESKVGLVWFVLDVGFCAPGCEHWGFHAASCRKGLGMAKGQGQQGHSLG